MELLLLAVLVGTVVLAGAWWLVPRGRTTEPDAPPPRAWASETVTPVMMGPRSKAPERVARRFVVDQGAFLALTMAQADGEIVEAEREVVRRFIRAEGRDLDDGAAEQALSAAEGGLDNPIQLANTLEGLRALGSEEQRQILIELLVDVARADGTVKPTELAFMERVGAQLGLSAADVQKRIGVS